jgi:hypothetical protein
MSRPNVHIGPDARGFTPTQLITFTSWNASDLTRSGDAELVLNSGERASAHRILDLERLATGEELITIRTRASLSGLPDLIAALLPAQHATLILEQYQKAANSAFRDDAESVIDRCREAATAALNAERISRNETEGSTGKDLAKLAGYFSTDDCGVKGGRPVMSNAARILALLHSRSKSVERFNRGNMAPSNTDAETALSLLGLIYRELGWAR